MNIGVISIYNPNDQKTWSGTQFSILNALRKEHKVEWIKPSLNRRSWYDLKAINIRYRLKGMDWWQLLHPDYDWYHSVAFSKDVGADISKKIDEGNYDILLALQGPSEMAFLQTDKPVIYVNDTTFAGICGYYDVLSNLTDRNVREGNIVEGNALRLANRVIMSSSWAIRTAIEFYGIEKEKFDLIHFGANLSRIPRREELKHETHDRIKLLFVGGEWKRKGGDIAVETTNELRKAGVRAELTVIGSAPNIREDYIRIIPFLDKSNSSDFATLYNLFLESDLFILPTRAECSPIVSCEASAFGLPVISADTGGMPDYVENGVNGYRLSLAAGGSEYAEVIMRMFSDKETYFDIRETTRDKYDNELNWDVWLEKFKAVVSRLRI